MNGLYLLYNVKWISIRQTDSQTHNSYSHARTLARSHAHRLTDSQSGRLKSVQTRRLADSDSSLMQTRRLADSQTRSRLGLAQTGDVVRLKLDVIRELIGKILSFSGQSL